MKKSFRMLIWVVLYTATAILSPFPAQSQDVVEELRQVERDRLRSLVDGDMDLARKLHADEFQLIIPAGVIWSKNQYLGGIEEVHSGTGVGSRMAKYRSNIMAMQQCCVTLPVSKLSCGAKSLPCELGTQMCTSGAIMNGKSCGPKQPSGLHHRRSDERG